MSGAYDRNLLEHVSDELVAVEVEVAGKVVAIRVPEEHLPTLVEAVHLVFERRERRREALAAGDLLMDAHEVAAMTGLALSTVYNNAERLGGVRQGRRWCWCRDDVLDRFDPFPGYGWLR